MAASLLRFIHAFEILLVLLFTVSIQNKIISTLVTQNERRMSFVGYRLNYHFKICDKNGHPSCDPERGAQRTKSKGLRAKDDQAMAKFVIVY